jgi:hypothetical protein
MVNRFREAGITAKRKMRNAGGPVAIALDEATHVAEILYRTAFEKNQSGPAMAVPYITSFCAHTSDQGYEQRNGLLSQWRGYARGGYAIVFDTKKLCDLYRLEGKKYYYLSSHISDVVYQGDAIAFQNEFGERLEKIRGQFLKFFESGSWEMGDIFGDVLLMFTCLKHRGFFEEREVRSVAFPVTQEMEENNKRAYKSYVSPVAPLKRIHVRGDGVPYIKMFDFEKKSRLPIRRIIIGPQSNQAKTKKEIEDLVGKNIEVHCSETPLSWSSG